MKTTQALLSIALLTGALAATAMEEPKIGVAAPDFTATDNTGKVQRLADYRGKYVVLEWTNHGCPFVKKQYDSGEMQKLQKQYKDKVVWFTVNSSAKGKQGYVDAKAATAELKQFKAEPAAVLLDPKGTLGKLYAASTTPDMYVIDPKGTLIYEGAIDDKQSTDPKEAPKTNYVQAALDEALAGKAVTTASTKSYGCGVKYSD